MQIYQVIATRTSMTHAAAMLGWKLGDTSELHIRATDPADAERRAAMCAGRHFTYRATGETVAPTYLGA